MSSREEELNISLNLNSKTGYNYSNISNNLDLFKEAMIRQLFVTIILVFIGLSSAWADDKCALTPAEDQAFSVMSFNDFDQTPIGWRRIAKLGCYHQAALLIDKYLAQHKSTLQDWQVMDATWHAGQMYAFNNEYDVAKDRFKASINPTEPKNSLILWNAYVNASIAFLDKNMAQLQYYRSQINAGPLYNGKKANLDVVDQLILNFDQPYSVAYCKAQ